MSQTGSPAGLRAPAERGPEPRSPRIDEDWILALLGIAVVVVTVGLAVLVAVTAHQRDAALQNAAAAARRLDTGGLDGHLDQNLIALQQNEIDLFQAHTDAAGQGSPQAPASRDPDTDLSRIYAGLAALRAQFGGSPQVQRDVSLITDELPYFTSTEATAQTDNEHGLPLGAAYLREASGYLTSNMLPAADNIRQVDQAQVRADDATAGRAPSLIIAAGAGALALLVWVQLVMARYSRRRFSRWLTAATVVAVIGVAGPAAMLAQSQHAARGGMTPHAEEAAALAQALVDGVQAQTDDALTLADHGEDCSAQMRPGTSAAHPLYTVTCTFETAVVNSLSRRGRLRADLGRAGRKPPDATARRGVERARAAASNWLRYEEGLPTLQSLVKLVDQEPAGSIIRYDPQFLSFLTASLKADPQAEGTRVRTTASAFQAAIRPAITGEWAQYRRQEGRAGGALTGLVTGGLLVWLLAGALAAAGVGRRVAEYWAPGGRAA
jgi:hypothetical protein